MVVADYLPSLDVGCGRVVRVVRQLPQAVSVVEFDPVVEHCIVRYEGFFSPAWFSTRRPLAVMCVGFNLDAAFNRGGRGWVGAGLGLEWGRARDRDGALRVRRESERPV